MAGESRDHALPIHPVDQRGCHFLRLFKCRQVPAIGDYRKARTADRARDFTRQLRRRRLIAVADKD